MNKTNTLIAALVCLVAHSSLAQVLLDQPAGASTAAKVSQTIGITEMTINYSRPGVKDREIWGGLVPEGQVWRAGANKNTIFTTQHDIKVEGKDLGAGDYGLHIIPNGDKATVIFSTNSTSWGSYTYDEKEDALRVEVSTADADHTEWLTYSFDDPTANSVVATLSWGKKSIPFKIDVDVHKIVVDNMKLQLRDLQQYFWQGPWQGANYCLNNDVELELGLKWADNAIAIEENFTTVSTKAGILTKLGKTEEADKLMAKAVDMPSATAGNLYTYGRTLIGRGDKEGAMEIFKLNAKRNKDHWLAPHGMARAYSAMGQYEKALGLEKTALSKCPEGSKQFLEGFVKQLEKGEDFN